MAKLGADRTIDYLVKSSKPRTFSMSSTMAFADRLLSAGLTPLREGGPLCRSGPRCGSQSFSRAGLPAPIAEQARQVSTLVERASARKASSTAPHRPDGAQLAK